MMTAPANWQGPSSRAAPPEQVTSLARRVLVALRSGSAVSWGTAQAGGAGLGCGLGSGGDLEFGEDGGDVVADGLRSQAQAGADRGVGQAGGQEVEDLVFAGGELRKGVCGAARGAEVAEEAAGYAGAEDGLAVGYGAYGSDDQVWFRAFQDVTD